MSNATKVQHTPGPWEAIEFDGSAEVIDAQGYRVADVEGTAINRHWLDEHPDKHWASGGDAASIERPQEEIRANAMLIEAAPDLLAALQDITADYETMHGAFFHRVVAARAAIAKARGEG